MTASPASRKLRAVITEPAETFLYRVVSVLGPLLRRLTDQDWRHQDLIPAQGGLVVCANHISNFDPLAVAHFLIWSGRWPRYLAKASLWKIPVIKTVMVRCGQIPVERHSADASVGLAYAIQAVRAGQCVVVYPEGTITRDPDLWPMKGKTGAARIALEAGVPVVPIGQWGAQSIMPGLKPSFPRLFPKKTMRLVAGPPVELDDLRTEPISPQAVQQATSRIMAAITDLASEVRGEQAPNRTPMTGPKDESIR